MTISNEPAVRKQMPMSGDQRTEAGGGTAIEPDQRANLDAALVLAAAGIFVFPAILTMRDDGSCGKRPAIGDWQNKATTDVAQIRSWWQSYPGAVPGIELGRSGLVVLDGDRHGGPDGVAALEHVLGADTPVHPVSLTAGAGVHRIFRQPADGEPLSNARGDLPAGIDVRGRGGWIVAPGSVRPDGQSWRTAPGTPSLAEAFRAGTIPEVPAHVVGLIRRARASISERAQATLLRSQSAAQSAPPTARLLSYGRGLLANVCGEVRAAAIGTRNETLNKCAYRAGRAVGAAMLDRGQAERDLLAAAMDCGLVADDGEGAVFRTIHSGLNAGEQHPLGMPADRPLPDVTIGGAAPIQRSTVLHWHDNDNALATQKWLVKKMLPECGVALISGQWSAGKTFVALHLAECVGTGKPFAGRLIKRQGGVLFLAAEAAGDIPLRLLGITEAPLSGKNDKLPFAWVDEVPPILAGGSLERMLEIARQAQDGMREKFGLPLALIIVDTMAAAAGFEDENDAGQAQKVMNVLQHLSRATGALVIAVDHFGKNKESGTRGSSAKEASADAVLALETKQNDQGQVEWRKMSIRKLRGGATGDQFPFALESVSLGTDGDGDAITTCVVSFDVELPPMASRADRWKGLKHLQQALHVAFSVERQSIRPFGGEGPQVQATLMQHVRQEFYRAYGSADDDPARRKEAARKQLQRELQKARLMALIATREIGSAEFVWFCDQPAQAAESRSPRGASAFG